MPASHREGYPDLSLSQIQGVTTHEKLYRYSTVVLVPAFTH
jgi:hypothetical protein